MTEGLILRTNGKVEPITINSLGDLQKAVGGLIEVCTSSDDWTLWANDEGRLLELPLNQVAREFVAEICQVPIGQVFSLHGDMVLVGCDEEGERADAPEAIRTIAEGLSMFDEPMVGVSFIDADGNIDSDMIA